VFVACWNHPVAPCRRCSGSFRSRGRSVQRPQQPLKDGSRVWLVNRTGRDHAARSPEIAEAPLT